MEILLGTILGVIFVSIIVFCFIKLNKNTKDKIVEEKNGKLINNVESTFPDIQIIENNTLAPLEKNKISDSSIEHSIAILDNSISNSIMVGKNIKNATELLNNKRAFFSATKKGTENMIKINGTNERIGTQAINGKFNKQTKFLEENRLIQSSGKDALLNAGFSATSMIVGQYYMNEINNKLDIIKDNIQGISDLLDSEFQGKLGQIISKMQEIIDNKVEILNNEYSRDKRYNEVLDLEQSCTKLLGQANEMIKNNITDENIDYKKYERQTNEIYKWFSRQQILRMLLIKIGDLRYVLSYGNETSKLSHTQYNYYIKQINSVNEELENWHKLMSKKLGIDTKEFRRNGKFYTIKKNTIGKIKEDWAYHKLNNDIVALIDNQSNIERLIPYTNKKQDDIIKIQKYNGKYYNLLNE
ncbi:hypothetical protein [uncultured Clostridium sp.]|jgi:hypothetical protein|uniref:hypothetical protein n=1 Tax=uncultured Clostridium sp. TaxID=59620 RepID=UPI00272A963C|nr:hypothetical protein [uncultured Clostridium sp.]